VPIVSITRVATEVSLPNLRVVLVPITSQAAAAPRAAAIRNCRQLGETPEQQGLPAGRLDRTNMLLSRVHTSINARPAPANRSRVAYSHLQRNIANFSFAFMAQLKGVFGSHAESAWIRILDPVGETTDYDAVQISPVVQILAP
jgi:hypothetical protein